MFLRGHGLRSVRSDLKKSAVQISVAKIHAEMVETIGM
jgi:hypothetical protein